VSLGVRQAQVGPWLSSSGLLDPHGGSWRACERVTARGIPTARGGAWTPVQV